MVSIARKNIFSEKTRLFISVGGVAFSVLLILILMSLYQGWKTMMTNYIQNVDAQVWVVQKGASDMFHSVSIMPQTNQEEIENIEGVSSVNRLLGRQVSFNLKGDEVVTFMFGYDVASGLGGPLRVVEGQETPGRGEIIIDRIFASNKELKIGDKLEIGKKEFSIVGISEGGNLIFYQYSFTDKNDAEEVYEMEKFTNFYLVKVADPGQIEQVKKRIESKIEGVEALTSTEFSKNNQKLIDETFLPILGVLIIIGFFIGVAVIGLTIYNATIEKSREYGILKAIGLSNASLYKIIFQQSLISATLGFVGGVALTFGINELTARFVPEFVTVIRWQDIIIVFFAAILMSVLAAYLPIRRIAKIDPAEVFKE